jgi:6,7-dimethyl-8-ribityllumazine synthase
MARKSPPPRYGIVASRFNEKITEGLLAGAISFLKAQGVSPKAIDVTWVPGAFELPVAALRMAKSRRYPFVVAVGCILAGQTPQYQYLAQAAFQGLSLVAVLIGIPIPCGVVVAKKWRHALERSRGRSLNRGWEAAKAGWEMVHAR